MRLGTPVVWGEKDKDKMGQWVVVMRFYLHLPDTAILNGSTLKI